MKLDYQLVYMYLITTIKTMVFVFRLDPLIFCDQFIRELTFFYVLLTDIFILIGIYIWLKFFPIFFRNHVITPFLCHLTWWTLSFAILANNSLSVLIFSEREIKIVFFDLEADRKKEDFTRYRSLNGLELPGVRKNIYSYLTSVYEIK